MQVFPKTFGKEFESSDFSGPAALLPGGKELLNLLLFDEDTIIEPQTLYLLAEDSKNYSQFNLQIVDQIEKIEKEKIIICNHLGAYQRLFKIDILKKVMLHAIEIGSNVFAFDNIYTTQYEEIIERANKEGLKFYSPIVKKRDYYDLKRTVEEKVPCKHSIAIVGTGSNQGKFTLFLKLKRLFKQYNITINTIGTENHSELFGINYAFPYGAMNSVQFSVQEWPDFLRLLN